MRLLRLQWLTVGIVVLGASAGCKSKAATTDPTLSSGVVPGAASTNGTDIKATVKLPPIDTLIPKRTFDFGGKAMTLQLCRFDASAPPIVAAEPADARAAMAAAPDGTIYVTDAQQKLRHYVNRSSTGCELVLDHSFGDGGLLDLKDASGHTRGTTPVVDDKGIVYVTGEETKRVDGGKLVPDGDGFLRAQPGSKLSARGDSIVGGCNKGTGGVPLAKGFDPKAPQYARPHVVGLFGDELVVRGTDMDGTKEVSKIGIHGCDGVQRLKLGKKDGPEVLWGVDSATRCGDDLCIFAAGTSEMHITRYTRAGAFVQSLSIPNDRMQKGGVSSAGDDKLWFNGAVSTDAGDGPKDKYGHSYAGVIVLARTAPATATAGMAGPLRGTLRGRPFLAMNVAFQYRRGEWRVELTGADRSSLTTTLLTPPGTGSISIADKSTGKTASTNAFLPRDERIKMSSDVVGSAEQARVEITSWNPAPYDAKKGSTQTVGYASGRLSITMPYTKDGTKEDSSCAGEFEDALITLAEDPSVPTQK